MASVNNVCKAAMRMVDLTCFRNFGGMSGKRMGEVALNVAGCAFLAGITGGWGLGLGVARGFIIGLIVASASFAYQTHEVSRASKVADGVQKMKEHVTGTKDPATKVGKAIQSGIEGVKEIDFEAEAEEMQDMFSQAARYIKQCLGFGKPNTKKTVRQ